MAIFKRGKVYWYEFKFNGVRHQVSSKSSNKAVCIQLEREHHRQLELGRGGLVKPVQPLRCSQAMTEFRQANEPHWAHKTKLLHKNNQTHLNPEFGGKLLNEITADDIAKYQGKRKKAGASGRSINIEIGLLRLVLKKAKLWSDLVDDVKMLKERSDIGRELSDDEQHRLLAACKASGSRSLYPAVLVSLHSGLRNEEQRLLRWRQVDLIGNSGFPNGSITVGKSKTEGGAGRQVPLSQMALQALQAWHAQFPDAVPSHYVFPSESYHLKGSKGAYGGTVVPHDFDPTKHINSWKSAWETAKKAAGVECRWHDMRHTAISRIAAAGAMDATIMALAGHLSNKMKERYSHTRTQAKQSAVAAAFDRLPTEVPTVN